MTSLKTIVYTFVTLYLTLQPLLRGDESKTNKQMMFGVTITDPWKNLKQLRQSLKKHSLRPTVRIVFDENMPPEEYKEPVKSLKEVANTMGEILDSYYVKTYSVKAYISRTKKYVKAFKNDVDIWEIGNEVNGDWLDRNKNTSKNVVDKINGAFKVVKAAKCKAAITFYYNASWKKEMPQYEMFNWINRHISKTIKQNIDYVFVSYYEDDCNGVIHTQSHWQKVFNHLHKIFPHAKLGFGEVGTKKHKKKAAYMKRYYSLNITTPNYIGGYFWWYYTTDCVPYTSPLWKTLDTTIAKKLNKK